MNESAIEETIKSGIRLLDNQEWFLKVFQNNAKIIIVGAVHIAEPLINFANHLTNEIFLRFYALIEKSHITLTDLFCWLQI